MANPSRYGELLAGASTEELAQIAAESLSRLEPGRQPLPLFTQIARLSVQSIVEVAPLRTDQDGTTQVLLAKREASDPWWPNQWHISGAVVLPTDPIEHAHDFATPLMRALRGDFGDTVEVTGQIQQFSALRRSGVRGSEQVALCWAEVDETTPGSLRHDARFFDAAAVIAGQLEENLVVDHQENIRLAVESYMASA